MSAVTPEAFVSVETVADFLRLNRAQVLKLSRSGVIRAYPVSGKLRHIWKYRLSEVSEDIACLRRFVRDSVASGSPRSSASKGKPHAE